MEDDLPCMANPVFPMVTREALSLPSPGERRFRRHHMTTIRSSLLMVRIVTRGTCCLRTPPKRRRQPRRALPLLTWTRTRTADLRSAAPATPRHRLLSTSRASLTARNPRRRAIHPPEHHLFHGAWDPSPARRLSRPWRILIPTGLTQPTSHCQPWAALSCPTSISPEAKCP